jgi:hypothetical protein
VRTSSLAANDVTFEAVQTLDRELAQVCRFSGSIRLAMGTALQAMARTSGHLQLGFTSIEAYALERCERSAAWTRDACCLARRVSALPRILGALTAGHLTWSMAQLIASVSDPSSEEYWVERALRTTVRQMRVAITEIYGDARPPLPGDEARAPDDELCTLTVTATQEDVWLMQAADMATRRTSGNDAPDEVIVEALVGEGLTSLLPHVSNSAIEPNQSDPGEEKQRAWNQQLAAWREEAIECCEAKIPRLIDEIAQPAEGATDVPIHVEDTPENIDRALRRVAKTLLERDLRIGEIAESLWQADGWRRLGYATAEQYSEERLGMSFSAVKARRTLRNRLKRLPRLEAALRSGAIGYEAAQLVARVANPETDLAWAERAAERTLVHLREEVAAAGQMSRIKCQLTVEPPSERALAEHRALKLRVITGAYFREVLHASQAIKTSQMSEPEQVARDGALATMRQYFDEQRRLPRDVKARGRVTVRLRVTKGLRRTFRWLERVYAKHRPVPLSFLQYVSSAVLAEWSRELPAVAYADVYARDGFRCTCPVCNRSDVTPHHVVYRAHGGADTSDNVTSLCVDCHLRHVHVFGSLRIEGRAPDLVFTIGRKPHTVVHGRRRVRVEE